MTELILVRHGETVWHAENRYAGISDVALSGRGLAQAQRLADWAAGAGLDGVVCSPMERARRTAEPAAAAAGLPLAVDGRLLEVDFGVVEGLTRDEMAARVPAALDAFLAAPASRPFPGGEAGADAVARALPALRALTGERVLVVAHQTLVRLLLCALLEIPLDRYRAVFPSLHNVARTTLRLGDGGRPPALLGFNVPTP